MTLTTTSLTIREVASEVAAGEVVEDAVARLEPDQLFPYLRRLEQVSELAGKWKRAIEARMTAEGRVGEHWHDEGSEASSHHEYAFLQSSRGDFADPRALFADLIALGIAPLDIASAVSKVRVTDLRNLAAEIRDEEKRAVVLETVEDHRVKVQGAARLVDLDDKYLKGAIAAKRAKQKED